MGERILDFGFTTSVGSASRRIDRGRGVALRRVPFFLSPALLIGLVLLLSPFGAVAQPYTRQINAFPVYDAEGIAYTHPWLGGLNVPRPQFVDIDADGDLDLFIKERFAGIMFFENIGTPIAHRFVWRTDTYGDLVVNEWARFADVDGDDDLDVLAEEPFSFIRYFRNDGTREAPSFVLVADTLKAIDGTPIFADRQNLPALADIDCDERNDLFIADLNGRLTYYANDGLGANGLPLFRFVTDAYQDIEIIGGIGKEAGPGQPVDNARHGANAITFADIEGDGDQDLFWGDFFSPSLYFIENGGTCEAPALELITDLFPIDGPVDTRGFNVPAFADLDADGDDDLFNSVLGGAFAGGPNAADNFYYYQHDADGTFTLQTRQFISSLDVDEESMPAFADLDADGDLDLLVGNKIAPSLGQRAQLFLFENEGTPEAPAFRLVEDLLNRFDPSATERIFNIAPALADLDRDDDVDVLLGRFDGSFVWIENTGTPQQPNFALVDLANTTLFVDPTVDIGQNSTPTFFDIDGDEDLDLFVGEAAGTVNLFRNTGTPEQARFELELENIGSFDAGARSAPTFHEVTGDGLPDLLVGAGQDGIRVYRNTSTAQTVAFAEEGIFPVAGTVPRLAAPVFADLDTDGDADFLVGGLSGGLFFYRNNAINTALETISPRLPVFISNYPNPFRGATTLHVQLAEQSHVRLVVYDMLGRIVAVPVDGLLPAGDHYAPFNGTTLSSGVYFYTLTTGGGATLSGTMLKVR